MKFKWTNLRAAFMGDTLNTFKAWWLNFRLDRSRLHLVGVNICDLTLAHKVGDHPKTIQRIEKVKDAVRKKVLTPKDISELLPSDDYILVNKHNVVINGCGRVGALQKGGYWGKIEVKKEV